MQGCRIEVSPAFAIGLGLLICLDPAELCLPFLLAAALHEAGHVICLFLSGVEVQLLHIGLAGAELHTGAMGRRQELLCAAAGPFVNLLCGVLCLRIHPRFALISLLLAGFNLLPVYPLDGGRVLLALWPAAGETVSRWLAILLLLGGAVLTAVLHQGLWPLLLLGVLLTKIASARIREQKMIENQAFSVYNSGR